MYLQPLDGSVNGNSLGSTALSAETEGTVFGGAPVPASDNISRFVPPSSNALADGDGFTNSGSVQGLVGPLMGMLQQLMQMLQSLMGYGGNAPYGPNGSGRSCPPSGREQFFQNATGSSEGDPHLSFNGARWNNMTSQPDLLNSDSIAGGFRVSTQVTPANEKGVTWNQSATISLNNGATTISMNNSGEASVTSFGQQLSIAPGQTLQLGNGESVTCEANGSLRITAENGTGGCIETALAAQGKGVNVDVTARDVDLGGSLVTTRYASPISTPQPLL